MSGGGVWRHVGTWRLGDGYWVGGEVGRRFGGIMGNGGVIRYGRGTTLWLGDCGMGFEGSGDALTELAGTALDELRTARDVT